MVNLDYSMAWPSCRPSGGATMTLVPLASGSSSATRPSLVTTGAHDHLEGLLVLGDEESFDRALDAQGVLRHDGAIFLADRELDGGEHAGLELELVVLGLRLDDEIAGGLAQRGTYELGPRGGSGGSDRPRPSRSALGLFARGRRRLPAR